MWLDLHPGYWLLIVDWTIRLAALWWIPSRSRPAAARSWLLLVGFVPLLGLPVYLVLGQPWVSRERRERQARASQRIREEQRPLAALRAPDGFSGAAIAPLIERLGGFMPMRGNAIELLDDYDASLARLIADLDGARHEAHLLYYLMFDDAVAAAVAEALLRASARGVRCRLLLDAVGAKPGLRAWTRRLRAGGVQVRPMLAGGLVWRRSARMDMRNHRKLAVIDGGIGYTGSQNLAAPGFVPGYPNRELVVRASGPVVAQLAALFASDWYLETGEVLPVSSPVAGDGNGIGADMIAQVLPSGPAYPFENARDCVVALLQRARRRAVLSTPYFVPDEATLGALRIAALSGVEVVLILSYTSNQRLAAWAQASYFQELLDAGVRIIRHRPNFLHAKHLSIDDDVALIGSINLDIRSFALNAEVGMLCYGRDVVARLHAVEAACMADSEPVDPDRWRRRPGWQRTRDGLARLADSLI